MSEEPLKGGDLTAKDVVQQPRKKLRRWHRKAWAAKIYAENNAHWRERDQKRKFQESENRAAEKHLTAAGIVFKKST